MEETYARIIKLIGQESFKKIQNTKILIVGVGGVGSYAAEAVARMGFGEITLMDGDEVNKSNLNRQIVALHSTIGRNKAEVMCERISDINPDIKVSALPFYYTVEGNVRLDEYDWIIDAIDNVDSKTALICNAKNLDINIVSSMGAAGKFHTEFTVTDIYSTSVCPLAKVMRKRLKEAGVKELPVVYSKEKPMPRRGDLGTVSYVPGSLGLEIAGYVIRCIIDIC